MRKIQMLALMASLALPMVAQENLLEGATIQTLGEAKEWSNGDKKYEFVVSSLEKLLNTANTDNVYLYPENGDINTEENQAKGGQVFYITLPQSKTIGSFVTTWEGATSGFNIYITDEAPTEAILETTPAYSVESIGQVKSYTSVLEKEVSGKYIVFQPTKALNWGWGIKMQSISAFAPMDDELSVFNVSPKIVLYGEATDLTISCLNQLGIDITDSVDISVSGGATYTDGKLTVTTSEPVVLTASHNDIELTQTIYVATSPTTPNVTNIAAPIFTNGDTDNNNKVDFQFYNGGAKNNGLLTFEDGAVAYSFSNTICVFFTNTETLGTWNALGIDAAEKGYATLNLDLFSDSNVSGTINFNDGAYTSEVVLKAGEWVNVVVSLDDVNITINNMSLRIPESDACDILFTNAYFANNESTGIEFKTENVETEIVDVINLQGQVVKKGVTVGGALENLPKGIYIVGGQKVVKK